MTRALKLLINPYERLAGYTSLGLGIVIALCSLVPAYYFNTRFDGVLDIHYVSHVSWYTVMADQLVNVFSLMLVFTLAGLLVKGNTFRLIDVCGTIILARFPFLVAPFLNMGEGFTAIQHSLVKESGLASLNTASVIFLILVTLFLLVLLVWYVTLLYHAYKISTNAKGWKVVVSFNAAILLAEVLSKILIYQWSV